MIRSYVAGGAGLIGSHLIRELLWRSGQEVSASGGSRGFTRRLSRDVLADA
jgi:nucleoside-diphosphate-sugar epimerase